MYVHDNFITDPNLIQAIKADDSFFPHIMETLEDRGNLGDGQGLQYHSEESSCHAPYMFWDGWWNSPADTLKKQVIQAIWEQPHIRDFSLDEVIGFEYWTRTFVPPQFLAHHVDEDTFLYAKNKKFNAPISGSVWYGFTDASEGGMLEIHQPKIEGFPTRVLEPDTIAHYISPKDERERVAHAPNRLVAFDVGRRLHETTPVLSGSRQVMIINVWHKDKPPFALEAGEFFYENTTI
jgi:hypothetical protein